MKRMISIKQSCFLINIIHTKQYTGCIVSTVIYIRPSKKVSVSDNTDFFGYLRMLVAHSSRLVIFFLPCRMINAQPSYGETFITRGDERTKKTSRIKKKKSPTVTLQ